jgi:hypothetical protein
LTSYCSFRKFRQVTAVFGNFRKFSDRFRHFRRFLNVSEAFLKSCRAAKPWNASGISRKFLEIFGNSGDAECRIFPEILRNFRGFQFCFFSFSENFQKFTEISKKMLVIIYYLMTKYCAILGGYS